MPLLWILIGLVVIVVVWALVSAYNGKPEVKQDAFIGAVPAAVPEYDDIEKPKANSWEEGAKTTVSKKFGKGGIPSGVASDPGNMAVKKPGGDDDWMKTARPFEPRATKLRLDEDTEEVSEAV